MGRVTVDLEFVDVSSGITTLRNTYTEGDLSTSSKASLLEIAGKVQATLQGPHQDHGKKIVRLVVCINGRVEEDLGAAGVLTEKEMMSLQGDLLEELIFRH